MENYDGGGTISIRSHIMMRGEIYLYDRITCRIMMGGRSYTYTFAYLRGGIQLHDGIMMGDYDGRVTIPI